jgi:hypothetical protein
MKKATRDRQESPVFKHDCNHCKFVIHANKTDYYIHIHDDFPSGNADASMIRRYSDEIEDNASRGLDSLCCNWAN